MGGFSSGACRALSRLLFCVLFSLTCLSQAVGTAHAVAGDLDPSFGAEGMVLSSFTFIEDVKVVALAEQSDGKIVCLASGQITTSDDKINILLRFLPGGALDTSFSSDGIATIDFGDCDMPQGLVVQSDGKIVVVGGVRPACTSTTGRRGVLARVNVDGSMDAGFGTSGLVYMDSAYESQLYGVTQQSDGKLVVVGEKNDFFCVARFSTTGVLDTSFNGVGMRVVSLGTRSHAEAVTTDEHGNIVAAGTMYVDSHSNFQVVRLTSTGAWDTTFGGDGVWSENLGSDSADLACGLVIDISGHIYVGGSTYGGTFGSDRSAVVVRITIAGEVDTSFGDSGLANYSVAGHAMLAGGITLDPQGRPVLAGSFPIYGETYGGQAWLIRFTTVGTLDRGFGLTGLKTVSQGSTCTFEGGLIMDSQGKAVCGGSADDSAMLTRHQTDDHSTRWGATWWWSDPERNDAYLLYASYMTIQATAGQDLYDCWRGEAPIFSRNLPGGAYWTAQTLINVPDLKTNTLTGLIAWNGNEIFNSYSIYVGLGSVDGVRMIRVHASVPGNCDDYMTSREYTGSAVAVRMKRAGGKYYFYYSADGVNWDFLVSFNTSAEFDQVGVMARSWSTTNDIVANYSHFKVFGCGTAGCLDMLLRP